MMKKLFAGIGIVGLLALAGCTTHVRGIVVDDRGLPVRDATFTIGRPDGVGTFGKFPVDNGGHFDFYISPTDESHLYLWNGKGDPETAMKRIDRSQIGDHMELRYSSDGMGE